MSNPTRFRSVDGADTLVWLPFALDSFLADAAAARNALVRRVPAEFTRNEWAYLMTALAPSHILASIEQAFGRRVEDAAGTVRWDAVPRGAISIWAPGNVSLLAPLVMLAAVASGNRVRLKSTPRAADLSGAFLRIVRQTPGAERFAAHLDAAVEHAVFDRTDPRSAAWASDAAVRIVFGSDAAARAIHALPHPLESIGFSFTDRRSEAWIEPTAVDDALLRDLAAVFAIYGQAGCTSPSRIVLVGGDRYSALAFRSALAATWSAAIRDDVEMHTASQVTRAIQWAQASGWDAVVAPRNGAALAVGPAHLSRTEASHALWITWGTADEAVATAPSNLQTIGHAVNDPDDLAWRAVLASTPVRRWVPVRQMHHFGWTWDGEDWWRRLFRIREWRR
jgi:hypothetical protein